MRSFRQYVQLREDTNNSENPGESQDYLRKAVELQIQKNPYVLASWLEANGDDEVKDMIKEYKNRRGNEPEGERGLGDLSNDNLESIKAPPHHPDSSNSNAYSED